MAITITQGAQILNEALRNYYGEGAYQIDTTSSTTIEEGFNKVGAVPPEMLNGILNQVNVVLVYQNYGTMFDESKNQTRAFWRDAVRYGGGLADIYQEILDPVQLIQDGSYTEGTWAADYAGKSASEKLALAQNNAAYHFDFHSGDVQKQFHTSTDRKDFAISVSELEISKAFTPEGFAGYVSVKIANLQWSAEVYLQQAVIDNIKQMVSDQKIVFSTGHNLNTMDGVTEMVETIKTHTDAMQNVSKNLNQAGICTISNADDIYLVTTPEFYNRMETRGAENAFNLNEYRIKNRIIMLPAGSDLGEYNGEQVQAVLVDRRAIVMAMRYWKMAPFVPTGTDWQNYFLKIEFIKGYNTFFNAVAYTGEPIDDFFGEVERGLLYVTSVSSLSSASDIGSNVSIDDYQEGLATVLENNGFYTDGVLVSGAYNGLGLMYKNASYFAFSKPVASNYTPAIKGVLYYPNYSSTTDLGNQIEVIYSNPTELKTFSATAAPLITSVIPDNKYPTAGPFTLIAMTAEVG